MQKIKIYQFKDKLIVMLGKDYYSSIPLNESFIRINGQKLFKTSPVVLRKIGFLLPRSSRPGMVANETIPA
jgi:hypothetical protein